MTGRLVGQPVNAVLIPPQMRRFEAVTGVDAATLDVVVTGWNKFVLMGADLVFLFPRAAASVEWFERELIAYDALAATGLALVPRVVSRWNDPEVSPFPFAACTRLRGRVPDDSAGLFDQLGCAIAQWHAIEPPALPGARPPAHHRHPHHQWLHRALDPATTADAVAEAADRLGRPQRAAAWTAGLGAAAQLAPVMVHGDIHEDQLLACDGELTGVVDWETVRVDHPYWDFDLQEWGTGLWRRHRREFGALWSRAWTAYAAARGLELDARPLETAFRIRHALFLLAGEGDPAVAGTLEEAQSHL